MIGLRAMRFDPPSVNEEGFSALAAGASGAPV
jgi:hypothetical protein